MDTRRLWGFAAVGLVALGFIAFAGREPLYDSGIAAYERQDFATAAQRFEWACRLRLPTGCYSLGILYRNGQGVPVDYARAAKLYRSACDRGVMDGCTNLGVLHLKGLGGPVDREAAQQLFIKACDYDVMACNNAGTTADELDRPEQAVTYWGRACDGMDYGACFSLGQAYHHGRGVKADERESERYLQKACDGGEAVACFNLGVNAHLGALGEKQPPRARELFGRACDLGYAMGCVNLGGYLINGQGGRRDEPKAIESWSKACSGRDDLGCRQLVGLLFLSDGGTPDDRAQATQLFGASCDAGVAGACFGLGYVAGEGSAAAEDLFLASCELGDEFGCSKTIANASLRPRVRAALDRIVANRPGEPSPLARRGYLAMEEGRDADARADFDRVLHLDPDDGAALNNRAWLKVRGGDFAGARTDVEAAMKQGASAAELGTHCWALAGLGEKQQALAQCKKAVALKPGESLNLGMIAFLSGNEADARREWDRALEESPAERPNVERWLSSK